jgi:hypothetical protein
VEAAAREVGREAVGGEQVQEAASKQREKERVPPSNVGVVVLT